MLKDSDKNYTLQKHIEDILRFVEHDLPKQMNILIIPLSLHSVNLDIEIFKDIVKQFDNKQVDQVDLFINILCNAGLLQQLKKNSNVYLLHKLLNEVLKSQIDMNSNNFDKYTRAYVQITSNFACKFIDKLTDNSLIFNIYKPIFLQGLEYAKQLNMINYTMCYLLVIGNFSEKNRDFITAKDVYIQLLEISKTLRNERLKADFYYSLGGITIEQRDFDSSFKFLNKSLDIAQKLDEQYLISKIYNNLGIIALRQRYFEKAESLFRMSIDISENIKDNNTLAVTFLHLGICSYEQKKYEIAKVWYKKSLSIFEKQGNENRSANLYNQLGMIAMKQNDFLKAEKLYIKSLKITENQENKYYAAITYLNLGYLNYDQLYLEEAEKWIKKSLEIHVKQGNEFYIAKSYNQLGLILAEKRNFINAEKYLKESLKIFKMNGYEHEEDITYNFLKIISDNIKNNNRQRNLLNNQLNFFNKYFNKIKVGINTAVKFSNNLINLITILMYKKNYLSGFNNVTKLYSAEIMSSIQALYSHAVVDGIVYDDSFIDLCGKTEVKDNNKKDNDDGFVYERIKLPNLDNDKNRSIASFYLYTSFKKAKKLREEGEKIIANIINNKKKFCLYLNNFSLSRCYISPNSNIDKKNILNVTLSSEKIEISLTNLIEKVLNGQMPVICISNKYYSYSLLGEITIPSISCNDDNWLKVSELLIKSAHLIIIHYSFPSKGIIEEIELINKLGFQSKTIVIQNINNNALQLKNTISKKLNSRDNTYSNRKSFILSLNEIILQQNIFHKNNHSEKIITNNTDEIITRFTNKIIITNTVLSENDSENIKSKIQEFINKDTIKTFSTNMMQEILINNINIIPKKEFDSLFLLFRFLMAYSLFFLLLKKYSLAEHYAFCALALSYEIDYPLGRAQSYYQIGHIQTLHLNKYTFAMDCLKYSSEIFQNLKITKMYIEALSLYTVACVMTDNIDIANNTIQEIKKVENNDNKEFISNKLSTLYKLVNTRKKRNN